jgi:haloalkane dehalogenase
MWRNIVSELISGHRCICVDLIGMGDSDRLPNSGPGAYSFERHMEFSDGFMKELGIDAPDKNVILVGHDWGTGIAFDWASRHPENISGIASLEPIVPPLTWDTWPPAVVPLFRQMRGDAENIWY